MVELKDLQSLAQLVDKMDLSLKKLEKYYQDNNSENFNSSKKETIDFQNKISEILKGV